MSAIKALVPVFICLLFVWKSAGQEAPLNSQLISHVPFNENSSGMWGYVDKKGIKYAVIGTASATRVYSLEDPANPIERFVGPGAVGIWREVRYFKDYIYVSTDQGADGLVIIDMTKAPDTINYSFYKPELTVGTTVKNLARCHNIFIDEKGYCYMSGCNINNRGVLVFDLNQDPLQPPFVGYIDERYSHDVYVKNDTMYNAEITSGQLAIYDVKRKDSIRLLTAFNTGRNFTHNAWTSDDSKYVFTTDERADAWVESYDISNFNNIKLLDRWRPLHSEGSGVIPHNTYYHRGYLVTSYYTDGVRIIDAHKPDNLVEVAYFDTWNDPLRCHNDFYGCWGVYPLEDTDLVYASDINNGLYIIKVDFKRACYLEGTVVNDLGVPVSNAKVEIVSSQLNRDFTGPSGAFKTGQVHDGSHLVRVTHPDFEAFETTVNLVRGQVAKLDVVMNQKSVVKAKFDIRNNSGQPVPAKIKLIAPEKTYEYSVDNGVGEYNLPSGKYNLYVSGWGYDNLVVEALEIKQNQNNEFRYDLAPVYTDHFENDLGWTIFSESGVRGSWVRAVPRPTYYIQGEAANPGNDSDDQGNVAFVTGNGINGASCDDVDSGLTSITSPYMDLTGYNDPVVNYDVYFFNEGGTSPINDTMVIRLGNGVEEIILDKIEGQTDGWRQIRNRKISDKLTITQSMYLVVEASDQPGSLGHIVEAGFDNFSVSEGASSVADPQDENWEIYPNPAIDKLWVRMEKFSGPVGYQIFDITGKLAGTGILTDRFGSIHTGHLSNGIYILKTKTGLAKRFVKN